MSRRFERFIKKIDGFFAPPEPVIDPLAEFHAKIAEQEAEKLQSRIAYAQRLRPFTRQLLLVSDFGSALDQAGQQEGAERVARAVASDVFSADTPLGVSIHLTHDRRREGQSRQTEGADLLTEALHHEGFNMILPPMTHKDSQDFWLRTVTLATENTAEVYMAEPDRIGHIAVVAALDLPIVGIGPQYTNGEAFLLTDTDDTPRFNWQNISE